MTEEKKILSAKDKRIAARTALRKVQKQVTRKAAKREAKAIPTPPPAVADHA